MNSSRLDAKLLEKSINIQFKNKKLLQEALTHRSFLNESKKKSHQHNERLEYLGDAVLELITTEHLFKHYPERQEGDLTSFRAALVRTESLAETARKIKLGQFLFMSHGEELGGGRNSNYILANAFEALIGAIYLDHGYETAKNFIVRNLIYKLDEIVKNRSDIDSKSKLQERSQEVFKQTPIYELIAERGPDHMKEFTLQVLIGNKVFGKGTGHSKQEAAQMAAKEALENWDKITKNLTRKSRSVKISKKT